MVIKRGYSNWLLNCKWNVAIYKDLNLDFDTKNSFCHEFAARNY